MMGKKKRLIILAIVVILIVTLIIVINNSRKEEEEVLPDEDETLITSDGKTKRIESNRLAEKRDYEGIEISNIRFEVTDEINCLLADVKNNTDKTTEEEFIDFHIYDKSGNQIDLLKGHILPLEPGEVQTISSTIATNGKELETYDVVVTKTEEPNPGDQQS